MGSQIKKIGLPTNNFCNNNMEVVPDLKKKSLEIKN